MKSRTTAMAVATIALVAIACSRTSGSTDDSTGSCAVLAKQCHPYGLKSAIGKECHDLGHDGDDTKCGPRKAECLAACPPIDGGEPHDAEPDGGGDASSDGGDGGGDGGDPVCSSYCTCMTETCATIQGYPYGAPGSCAAACAAFGSEARTCWPKFCESARALADKKHDCEHAWGFEPHCD